MRSTRAWGLKLNDGKALGPGIRFAFVMAQLRVPDLNYLRELGDAGKLQGPVVQTFPVAGVRSSRNQAHRQLNGLSAYWLTFTPFQKAT